MNKYKNIFLDRDGVINEIIYRKDKVSSPRLLEEFKIREDFLTFSKNIDKKLNFFLITNQPDISRRLLKLNVLKKMHDELSKVLSFNEIMVCMHDDKDNCNCRKPKPGLILRAISKYKLVPEECVMIGDSLNDMIAAKSAKIDFFLLDTDYNSHISDVRKIKSLISFEQILGK